MFIFLVLINFFSSFEALSEITCMTKMSNSYLVTKIKIILSLDHSLQDYIYIYTHRGELGVV